MQQQGVNKYQHAAMAHGNKGIHSIVELHDQALAALARAKECCKDKVQCDIELCDAASHLLAVPEIISHTSFTKLADTIAKFMGGMVGRIHRVTKTPNPAKTIDDIAETIVGLKAQWKNMAEEADRAQEQVASDVSQSSKENTNIKI